MSWNIVELEVIRWAEARGIIQNSSSDKQFMKAVEEMGELASALNKKDREALIDALGDVLVCLINLATIEDLDLTQCLQHAYDQIKDRKGYLTKEGIFVKEES